VSTHKHKSSNKGNTSIQMEITTA